MIDLLKVRAVFVKEMRDSLRDRRTLFATIIVPVLMYPLMMLVVSEAAQVAKAKRASEQYRVAVQPPELRAQVEALVQTYLPREEEAPGPAGDDPAKTPLLQPAAEREPEEAPQLLFQTSPNATEALKAGELQAILNVPREFVALLDAPLAPDERTETLDIQLFYDGAEHRSRQARDLLHEALDAYRKDVLNRRLAARDLEHSFLLPFRIDEGREYNVASAEKQTGSALGTLLPLLFIFVLITGALSPAIDLTVGEKERSTLETLIAAPVRPLEVIAGKFLTVATLAMLNACLNLTSFTLTFLAVGADRLMDFHFPWSALPATLLLLLPLGFFFSALMLAACSFATNYKEAQVFVLPIYVVPMIGLMVVTIPGIELEGPLLVAPVLNTALLIRELFLDRPNLLQPFLFVLVSTCLYAAAAVALAARIFAREEVLFSAQGTLRLFLSRRFFRPQAHPKLGDAFLVLALVFPAWFYLSSGLNRELLREGEPPSTLYVALALALPLYAVILGFPLIAAWYLKLDFRRTFRWRAPSVRSTAAALCLGGATWILAAQFFAWQRLIWPEAGGEELRKLSEMLQRFPDALALFVMALTPALCEEHFFRGFLLSGLRQAGGKWQAILAVGLIFGAFHIPMIRMPVTALLGILMAWLTWESRSLWPAALLHLLHNVCSVIFGERLMSDDLAAPQGSFLDLKFLLPAVVFFVAGLWLARNSGREEPASPPEREPLAGQAD